MQGLIQILTFLLLSFLVKPSSPENSTPPHFKIPYAAGFAESFVLDGVNGEFEKYSAYRIQPDTAIGPEAAGWAPGSADLDFKTTLVIDDDYLYLSAEVTDDDPRPLSDIYEAWQGDLLEFYIGFYSIKEVASWNSKQFARSDGDWRIGFLPTGTTAFDGWLAMDVPGVEAVVFPKFSGDGYVVEARITLDSVVAPGRDFKVYDGLKMPLKIEAVDQDRRLNGDTESSLSLGAGGITPSTRLDNRWMFPSNWGVAEIVGAPPAGPGSRNTLPEKVRTESPPPAPVGLSPRMFTDLETAIKNAEALVRSSVEGSGEGMYPKGSVATLQAAIEEAAAHSTPALTASREIAAVSRLYDACSSFESLAQTRTAGIVDKKANKQTRYLYLNLKNRMGRSFLFGMQHATGYGVGWSGDDNRSDIKDVCGDFPAIYGEELREVLTDEGADRLRYRIISAYERGGVITMSWHQLDPGNRGWNADKVNNEKIVARILPAGPEHEGYKAKLRAAAEFFKSLRGKNGEAIPVIFRPYHEHLGTWFWWGDGHCTAAEFNQLWRFTVDYLHDSLNVHNLLWAISPDLKFLDRPEDYFKRFPGNDYVDIYGVDFYYHTPLTDNVAADYRHRLRGLVKLALEHNKIPALTEIGQDGLDDPNWHTRTMINPIKYDSINNFIAYGVTWRNAGTHHFHAPYPGHPSVPDFLDFYNDPYTLFESGLPNMYALPEADRNPPVFTSFPKDQMVSTETAVEITVETDERALLRWSYTDEAYEEMPGRFKSGQGAFRHTSTIKAAQGSRNRIFVKAKDVSGNETPRSLPVSFIVDTLRAAINWFHPRYPVDTWQHDNGPLGNSQNAADTIAKVATAFFTKDFLLEAVPQNARIIVQYNGGFALYINGTEAFRHHLPGELELDFSTPPLFTGKNTKAVPFNNEMMRKLKKGKNRIAIEVHGGAQGFTFFDALLQTDPGMVFNYGADWRYFTEEVPPPALTSGEVSDN
ncbi:MAG: hypothetical protein H6560_18865 [Lewinellaceae bacterium]|nr:hypothetical protein [Lewinellaceae bacterium]